MKHTRNLFTLSFACWLVLHVSSSKGYAATHFAASCTYTDVNAAVSLASSGDTVLVPACSAVWNTTLRITKPIQLVGTGTGNTNITSGFSSSTEGLITIEPSPVVDGTYRVSGFTFDQSATSYGITLYTSTSTAINRLRIDHNEFKNVGGLRSIYLKGTFYGVIDNNTFTLGSSGTAFVTRGYTDDYPCTPWGVLPLTYGASTNIYFEDNIITGGDAPVATGQAGRYVMRYNSWSSPTQNQVPLIDHHGNQPTVGCAGMVTEIYGNDFQFGSHGGYLFDHRGGRALFFFNKATAGSSLTAGKVREEYADNLNGSIYTMHVDDSYYWAIRINGTLAAMPKNQDITPPAITENVSFFNQTEEFNGTSGMGCGPLASRPATCTTGVGYWATNQSCSDLSGMVGANPSVPIWGTLYKCSATNTWTAYYVPYTYPHPLRSDPPRPPENVQILR